MDKFNEWIHTGESDNGKLQIWCKIDMLEDTKYLKLQYKDKNGNKIGNVQDYPVSQIKMLNNLIDIYIYKTKYPHIDLNQLKR